MTANPGGQVTSAFEAGLQVRLESLLPSRLASGSATAIFCFGTCHHRDRSVESLELAVDGVRHRPDAWGMPRAGRHTGFWGTVPIPADEGPRIVELSVAARLAGGFEAVAALGRIEVVERRQSPSYELPAVARDGELIVICMGTFDPDPELFRVQVESLRAQTHDRWLCLISDDCSSPSRFAEIEATVAGDPRFLVSRADARVGFYRNYERALEMVPAEAELVALCDQDDRWHPEKLEVLREALGGAMLAYSDQRLVNEEGRVLRDTLWEGRRNNHTNIASLLIANSVTGAAALFRSAVVELALPFPDSPGFQFHDHWLGLVALAAGDVAYVERPLYDYVQHPGAVFGDVTSGARAPEPQGGRWRAAVERWQAAYFYGYVGRQVQARVLLVRCSAHLAPGKRRSLERFVASGRSRLALAWLAARPLRCLVGLTETLASETQLALGVLWRWLIAPRAHDAGFPAGGVGSFNQKRLRRWRGRFSR